MRAFLLESVSGGSPAQAAQAIAERLSERMKKGGAGFFGIGFFTVFGGADRLVVRTGEGGVLREAELTPVRDENGRLIDIRWEGLREYPDPAGARQGTEVLWSKRVSPQNAGRLFIENAYLHVMVGKYVGAVTDVAITLNGAPVQNGVETVGELRGLRSRLDPSRRARWTVDELFVQEPPAEGLSLVPPEIGAALNAGGWNLDFPAATPVVRTRASVQNPAGRAGEAAALALSAAYALYRRGLFSPAGLPSFSEHEKISPWDCPPPPQTLRRDAENLAAGGEASVPWEKYRSDPKLWSSLMMACCDDKEKHLRRILGPELCASLDLLRDRGEPLRARPLPARGDGGYEDEVRELHSEALARLAAGGGDEFDLEPAAQGLSRVLERIAAFIDSPPSFIPVGTAVWEGLRACLDEGKAVPLMEAVLESAGRGHDRDAVRLFEGWLKSRGAVSELSALFLGERTRPQAEPSLNRLWKAASRGRPLLLPLGP